MFNTYKRTIKKYITTNDTALVFSSKKILKQYYGKKINAFKNVIRFNDAKVIGYKKFVGNKTTLRLANTTILFDQLNRIKKKNIRENIVFISNEYIRSSKKTKFQKKFKQKIYFFDNRYYYFYLTLNFILNPYIFINCLNILILQKKNFSIGFLCVLILINLGIRPNIFGLDINENMSKRRHYYKNTKVGTNHNLGLEHKLLFELSRLKKLKIK